ncbi:MAG: hypothetical protein HC869_04960 [Rhodospirillales bacterium]|nr:hypothetical protein [Rhodospirillales bacterium]
MESISSSASATARARSIDINLGNHQRHAKAAKIVGSFNTWAFKREQPSDPALLNRFVMRALLRQQPLSFVLYWGKGPRSKIAEPDIQCLDYLGSLCARIKSIYAKGALISLVLTDTHATLNGHPEGETAEYHGEIACEARKRGFEHYALGELTAAAGELVKAEDCPSPSAEILEQLAGSAMRWYRGAGAPEDGARRYYKMNMMEKKVMELFFPSSVFATFNGSEHRELFPDRLPIFYMYSLRRGTSVKPWFLPCPDPKEIALAS